MPIPVRPPGEYLDVIELAALLNRTPGSIYVERHRGHPPGSLGVKVGRKLMFRKSDLDRWWDREIQAGGRE